MIIVQTLGWIALALIVGLAVGHATGHVRFGMEAESEDEDKKPR